MRRVALDLTGRLPRPSDLKAFVDDANPDKRATLVDQLLQSREFEEFWAFKWSQLLRIRSQPGDTVAAKTYYKWLREQVAKKTPYDQFAQQLLVSVGDTRQHGPANFYRTVGNAREQAEFASELWMGSRLRCANCHNHPLDRWTQDDYHGLAAIFAKLKRGQVIAVSNSGEVTHPRTGAAAIPRIPGADFLTENASNGRELLADWLTAPENPYFAKAAVNRMWKVMMGRGLVEPTDDFRATNPATHPALLEELATDFVANGYQWRHTLRRIALSDAYSRSAQTLAGNGADDRYYSHMLTRPLEAELLADAIADVTGVAEPYGEHPLGTRAIAVFDAKVPSLSLDILGRCSREESCESTDGAAGGLSRKLHLLNGPLLNRRINHAEGRLKAMLDAGISEMNIVDAFYELALSRSPSESEREFWKAQLHAVENPQQQQILEDFVWGLLNCREFVTHH